MESTKQEKKKLCRPNKLKKFCGKNSFKTRLTKIISFEGFLNIICNITEIKGYLHMYLIHPAKLQNSPWMLWHVTISSTDYIH